MSDPFFQKKRKRSGGGAVAGSNSGDANGRRAGSSAARRKRSDGVKDVGMPGNAAGPSRVRMRDRAKAGRGKSGADDDIGGDHNEDDDQDDGDEEGLEGMDTLHRFDQDVNESDEDHEETPAEARVRLAQLYLDSLRDETVDADDADAAEIDRANIASRLQADAAQYSTHVHSFVADRIVVPSNSSDGASSYTTTEYILACRGHRTSVTSAVVSHDCTSLWTAGKDGQIVRWRLRDGKMMECIGKGAWDSEHQINGVAKPTAKRASSSSSGAARRRARAFAAQDKIGDGSRRCQITMPSSGQGHNNEIWALSVSYDGKYLVSGGKDRRICVWAVSPLASAPPSTAALTKGEVQAPASGASETKFLKALGGHKDSISALQFRQGTHDLFSASLDRTMKLFDVSQLSYVETFFGHQEDISSLDVLRGELAVTSGSRDRTVRWWKVRDESQLVFRGGGKSKVREVLEGGDIAQEDEDGERVRDTNVSEPTSLEGSDQRQQQQKQQLVEGSIDAVAMVDEHSFLSGGDTGTIALWSLAKKKPVFSVAAAHGFEEADAAEHNGGRGLHARWITSLACLPYGDVFASGSWDGRIRLWRLSQSLKSFSHLCDVPAIGFVNSLQLLHPSRAIVKRCGGSIVSPEQWKRHGGLRGGAKKIFADDDDDDDKDAEPEKTSLERKNDRENDVRTATSSTSSSTTLLLVAAMGQEPVRGRWSKVQEARNGTLVVPFTLSS